MARDLRSRAPRDAPWRTRRRWSSTRTSWRGPPRRRGRSGTRPSCLCTHARDGVRRDGVNGALSSRARETRRLPGRIAPVDWSARSTSAFALNRFRRRFQTQNDESQASVDRSTSVALAKSQSFLVPPSIRSVAKPRLGLGEPRVNSFAPACGLATTPTHRTTPAHFSQWRRRTTSPRPRPRRRRCVPATRRTRVRMPVLILSPTSFLISQPRLANARRRGTAGPARDAICARRAAAVGTARPRRRQNPAPRDRRTIGSASASRRFARLT